MKVFNFWLLAILLLFVSCSEKESNTGIASRKSDTNLLGFYTTAEVHKGLSLYKSGEKAEACKLLLPNTAKDELVLVEAGAVSGAYSVSSCVWPHDKGNIQGEEPRSKELSYSCYFHGEILGPILYVKHKNKKYEWPAQLTANNLLLHVPEKVGQSKLEKLQYQKISDADADLVAEKIMISGCQ